MAEKKEYFALNDAGKYMNFHAVVNPGQQVRDLQTNKMVFDDSTMLTVTFENGVLSTDNEEIIDFCEKYNTGGKLICGRTIKGSNFPRITDTAPGAAKTVEKIVEKQVKVVPASLLEMLELENIVDIAEKEFSVKLEAKDKKSAIAFLKKEGFVS